MLHYFDSRFGTYEGQTQAQEAQGKLPELSDTDHAEPARFGLPRYWVPQKDVEEAIGERWPHPWLLGWRKLVRNTDQRTFISFFMPRVGFANSGIIAFVESERQDALAANLSSFCFDYVARQKLAGTNMGHFIAYQLPVITPRAYENTAKWAPGLLADWVRPRALELFYTGRDLDALAVYLGWHGPPPRWVPERRALLEAELDAAFFHLYGLTRNEVDYVMDSFWGVRDRDEHRLGDYRTKRLILERYDALAKAIETGVPYETILDPPPADPRVADSVTIQPSDGGDNDLD